MSLTKEQLLQPRYLCTGTPGKPLWPDCDLIHGDIISTTKVHKKEYIENFPHLFKPLQWWEHRKPEDMPEYVNTNSFAYGIKKVERWEMEDECPKAVCDGEKFGCIIWELTPATEQEYLDYKGLRKCPDCGSEWKGDDSCPECFPI